MKRASFVDDVVQRLLFKKKNVVTLGDMHTHYKHYLPLIISILYTYLFINYGTLDIANKIKTIYHINLIFLGIHIHPMPHVSCQFGYNIQKDKVIARILVKDNKNVLQ